MTKALALEIGRFLFYLHRAKREGAPIPGFNPLHQDGPCSIQPIAAHKSIAA